MLQPENFIGPVSLQNNWVNFIDVRNAYKVRSAMCEYVFLTCVLSNNVVLTVNMVVQWKNIHSLNSSSSLNVFDALIRPWCTNYSFWDVMPCSLTENYQIFFAENGGSNVLQKIVISTRAQNVPCQETVIIIVTSTRTSSLSQKCISVVRSIISHQMLCVLVIHHSIFRETAVNNKLLITK